MGCSAVERASGCTAATTAGCWVSLLLNLLFSPNQYVMTETCQELNYVGTPLPPGHPVTMLGAALRTLLPWLLLLLLVGVMA